MAEEPKRVGTVEIVSEADETWAMTSGYGVSAGVAIGVDIYEGDIAVVYVKGKRGGKTNTLRTTVEVFDRLCVKWTEAGTVERQQTECTKIDALQA